MLTQKTILQIISKGWAEPHYFGQSSMPRAYPRRDQYPIGPDSHIRIWNEELGANIIVRAPFTGE